jgi:pSer/pThr/pTyr-binding forkhead associated (FHA) protein
MATLYMLGDDGAMAALWEIGAEPMAIGRGASVDVKVDDAGLSRRHFMILREGEEYLVKDLSSRNGTWVHGARALTARLRHNDCILAGHTLFRFCEDRAAATPDFQPVAGPHGTEILRAAFEPSRVLAQTQNSGA